MSETVTLSETAAKRLHALARAEGRPLILRWELLRLQLKVVYAGAQPASTIIRCASHSERR